MAQDCDCIMKSLIHIAGHMTLKDDDEVDDMWKSAISRGKCNPCYMENAL